MSNNTQALQVFKFEENEIRTVLIDGDPWWVASDVCKVLGHSDVSMAVSRLDNDEKGTRIVCTPGGNQQMICISESGLYALIFTSRKSEAKRFRKWVTSEVLPSIRKIGSYSIHQSQIEDTRPRPLQQADILYLISHPEEIEEIREKLREGCLDLHLQSMQMQQQEKDLPVLQRLLRPDLVEDDPVEDERASRMLESPIAEQLSASKKPSTVSERIQSEILRHIDRLASRGQSPVSATRIRDYMPNHTRMQIEVECCNLVRQGVLKQVVTSHTSKYERLEGNLAW